jgi:hypothetical protein
MYEPDMRQVNDHAARCEVCGREFLSSEELSKHLIGRLQPGDPSLRDLHVKNRRRGRRKGKARV